MLLTKGVMNQVAAVAPTARTVPYLGGDAFHRLEDGMEIVLLKKFGPAEPQHIGMDAPLGECGVEPVRACEGLVDRSSGLSCPDIAPLRYLVTRKCQDGVEAVEAGTEEDGLGRVPGRVQRPDDEAHDVRADL